MKTIGFPTIFLKKYGGDIYTDFVKDTLTAGFHVETIQIAARRMGNHRYFKFIEFFYNLFKLSGRKDLWIRDFYSTISLLFDKTRGKNMALIFHVDFSGFPFFARPFLILLEKLFF